MERFFEERTIEGTRYIFEAQVDEGLWRINMHQHGAHGWLAPAYDSWSELPKNETPAEALVSFVDRFAFFATMKAERVRSRGRSNHD